MKAIKRITALALCALMLLGLLSGCGEKTTLDKKKPVTLNFWHVYGEQSGSPMDELVDEFNRTVGAEKGVRVTVTATSSASQIGAFLLQAQKGAPEMPEMPDVFTCHIGDALALGAENLLDWNSLFTEDEREEFVSGFLADGTADGKLLVFPMSKSTHVLMLNGSAFDRFSAATGAQYSDLTTWEGFYQTAGAFYDYSGGKTFCALDYPLRAVELRTMEQGAEDFYTEDDKARARSSFSKGLVGGIASIFVGIGMLLIFGENSDVFFENFGLFLLLFFVAIGCWLIGHFGMMLGRTNVAEYNKSAADDLEMEEIINAQVEDEVKDALLKRKRKNTKVGALCGAIMIFFTIIGLALLFIPILSSPDPSNFEPEGTTAMWFWLAWVAGGLVCGIVSVMMDAFGKDDK